MADGGAWNARAGGPCRQDRFGAPRKRISAQSGDTDFQTMAIASACAAPSSDVCTAHNLSQYRRNLHTPRQPPEYIPKLQRHSISDHQPRLGKLTAQWMCGADHDSVLVPQDEDLAANCDRQEKSCASPLDRHCLSSTPTGLPRPVSAEADKRFYCQ